MPEKVSEQTGFEDVPIRENVDEIIAAVEDILANKTAAARFAKAKRELKGLMPEPEKETRYAIGERYVIVREPHSVAMEASSAGNRTRVSMKIIDRQAETE